MPTTRSISVIPVGHTDLGTHTLEALRAIGHALRSVAPALDLGVRLLAALALLRADTAAMPGGGTTAIALALLLVFGPGAWSLARRIARRSAAA